MKIEDVQPLNDRFVIEVIADDTQKYEGMIAVMDTAQEKSNLSIVRAVPLGYNGPVHEGDTVMFNRHSGSVFKTDHFDPKATEYRLIKETDLLAKINVDNN